MSPRYRTRTGVTIDTSAEAAEFLGAESAGGGDSGGDAEVEQTAVAEAEPIAPASPEGGPAEPVQEPAEGVSEGTPDAQEPGPPAPDAQEPVPTPEEGEAIAPAGEPAPQPDAYPAATVAEQEEPAPAEEPAPSEPAPAPQEEAAQTTGTDYNTWTLEELQSEIRTRNRTAGTHGEHLAVSGTKAQLVTRLEEDDAARDTSGQ